MTSPTTTSTNLIPTTNQYHHQQPYLREMADLKDGSAVKSLVLTWGKKPGRRPQDIKGLVTAPQG